MSGWGPSIGVLYRDESQVLFVVQTGRHSNCGGIARITVRGARNSAPSSEVIDACSREATAPYRESAIAALRGRLGHEQGLRATIEDDYDHPVDLSRSKFADAGHLAGAFLGAWNHSPSALDSELIAMAWEEEERRFAIALSTTSDD